MPRLWQCCLFIVTFGIVLVAGQKEPNICKSITVKTLQDFEKLKNCSIIAGHVQIAALDFTPETLANLKPLPIEEITEYLLVYRVNGLDTLERLFPKLLVIRGIKLLYDKYGLVILENRNLENIGLVELLRVFRGSIRIESNPLLCYAHTINWVSILGNRSKKYHYILNNNKPPNFCPLCYGPNPSDEERHRQCWSLGKFQRHPMANYTYPCLAECPNKKCNEKGKCCSDNCLTGCNDENCKVCIGITNGKKCIRNCMPPNALAFGRQCVPYCHKYNLLRFGSECVDKCPALYQSIRENDGEETCTLNCSGNFTIKSSEDLKGFEDCGILEGSLTIELTDIKKTSTNDLDIAFANLREIKGYLKIVRSPQLVSLHFFKNLHTIAGNYLAEDKYSFYVVNNHHLENLWNTNQKVSIPRGHVYFHLNPRLCYDKIEDLKPQLKEADLTVTDASRNSNGEQVYCESIISELNATIDAVNAHEARVLIEYLSPEALTPLIGYIFYYKEAPKRNITNYDNRHGCGHDNWFVDTAPSKQRRHILRNLRPYTQYAYFVKTLTISNYHYQVDASSDIQYFRTTPARPGPLQKIYYRSLSPNEIEIHWWPPRITNGAIEKYTIKYDEVVSNRSSDTFNEKSQTQPATHYEFCHCPTIDPELSGPMPVDDDYFQREQMVYDESMYNFIYVPSKAKKANKTVSLEEVQENFQRVHEEMFNTSIKEQDHGKNDFNISIPLPVCNVRNPSMAYKVENNCQEMENIEKDLELPSTIHTYTLKNLKPHTTYRIRMRACVEGLVNGCGPETTVWAETVSEHFVQILQSLNLTPVLNDKSLGVLQN
uniref:Fibronectin type-III domain-containing protein n=1 Tax=Stomoxys calcitrans TaxID=35570 RepID=A0A1I8PES9_STOCA